MKTIFQFLLLALLFLPNSSCLNKDPIFDGNCSSGCIVFLGTVTDPNGDPVPSEILINKSGSFFGFEQLLGELETDSDGRFDFRFDGSEYKTGGDIFTVSAHRGGYISDDHEGKVSFFNIDSTNFDLPTIANITLSPSATIKLGVTVDMPGIISQFRYSLSYLNRANGYAISDDSLKVNQDFSHTVGGDQAVMLKYSYKRLDDPLNFEESIFIEGGEEKEVEIHVE